MDLAMQTWLAERWVAARRAWPGVELPPEAFYAWVAARAGSDEEMRALRTDELYLTCACAHGDRRAFVHLESRYFGGVAASLSRLRLGILTVDELTQILRARLFVTDGKKKARISGYSGRGDLGSWMRVIAVRAALRQLRSEKRVRADAQRVPAPLPMDAELGHLKRQYGGHVRAALSASLEGLGTREKNLLWQYYLDGLTIEQIGALYGAHRVTVARWLDAIRQRLLDDTRHALGSRLRASQHECDSIIRMVQSQIDLTLNRLLDDK
jgi:RNA polymerase sigma-70 factor (ECF subfamily)